MLLKERRPLPFVSSDMCFQHLLRETVNQVRNGNGGPLRGGSYLDFVESSQVNEFLRVLVAVPACVKAFFVPFLYVSQPLGFVRVVLATPSTLGCAHDRMPEVFQPSGQPILPNFAVFQADHEIEPAGSNRPPG